MWFFYVMITCIIFKLGFYLYNCDFHIFWNRVFFPHFFSIFLFFYTYTSIYSFSFMLSLFLAWNLPASSIVSTITARTYKFIIFPSYFIFKCEKMVHPSHCDVFVCTQTVCPYWILRAEQAFSKHCRLKIVIVQLCMDLNVLLRILSFAQWIRA